MLLDAFIFIESQPLGGFSIAWVGKAIDISKRLTVGVYDLEAAV